MPTTTTVSRPSSSPSSSFMHLNKPSSSRTSTSALQSLRSLYQRAARSFLQRDALQTQDLIDCAFEIIDPPPPSGSDLLASQRKKWDILRVTLETTVYSSPGLIPDDPKEASSPSPFKVWSPTSASPTSPSGSTGKDRLRANLLLSPPSLLANLHARSLRLFTPSTQKPSPSFLPSQILISLVLASLKLDCPQVGRGLVEEWLARRSIVPHLTNLPPSQGGDGSDDGYLKVLEVYCLHVLPRLGEWEYADEFLKYEVELPVQRRKHIQDTLKSLHEQSLVLSDPPSPDLSSSSSDPATGDEPLSRPLSRVSSTSSLSSHTAVPSTPRPTPKWRASPSQKQNGNAIRSKSRSRSPSRSTAATVKPSKSTRPTTSTNLHHAITAASSSSSSSSSHHQPDNRLVRPSSSSVSPQDKQNTFHMLTSNLAWLRATYLPQLKANLPIIVCVLIPLLGLLARLKRARAVNTTTSPPGTIRSKADEARKRLGIDQAGGSSIWASARKAITDAVVMAGRGLV